MKLLIVLGVFISLVVGSVIVEDELVIKTRQKRFGFFTETTTVKPTTTTTVQTVFPDNDLSIGECRADDKVSCNEVQMGFCD